MKNKFFWPVILIIMVSVAGLIYSRMMLSADKPQTKEIPIQMGSIEKAIAATAVVQPKSRLEMKSPVSGRIESIKAFEGQSVKAGDVLALLSSTERAALLDAARLNAPKEVEYWKDIYKPIALIAPADATVIVSTMQPGQAVTPTDAVIVLSDRLIVQAQVDETDIGKVETDQEAMITLDAYPDIEIKARVGHIYHESKTINNVTIYLVDVLPDQIPDVFRSGMSANIEIILQKKENILIAPLEAVKKSKEGKSYVYLKKLGSKKVTKQEIQTGLSDENNVEILSGASKEDTLVLYSAVSKNQKSKNSSSNPFMPQGQRGNSRRSGS